MSNMQPGEGQAITPGTTLGGKYRVLSQIGKGGMGVVLLALHEALDQRVAIKLLTPEVAGNAETVVRLMREARAAAKLQSDHVARVSDVGTWEGFGPYIVMEYLEGVDLDQLVRGRGPLPCEAAVDYVLEALDAIAEAHSLGIVHRDLKPSNLFLATRADGERIIKVLDFGISKMDSLNEPTSKLTSTRSMMGSPAYMSPEQLRSAKKVDARADIWSLGVVIYELLTSNLPFEGETTGELFANILESPPIRVRDRRPDVPELLDGIIQRCLRRDPNERFPNAADLAQALAPFGSGRSSKKVERAVALIGKRGPGRALSETNVKPLADPAKGQPAAKVAAPSGVVPAVAPDAAAQEAPALAAAPRPAQAGTQGSWGTSAPQSQPRSRAWIGLVVAAVVGVLVLGIGIRVLGTRARRASAAPAPSAESFVAAAAVEPEHSSAVPPAVPPTGDLPAASSNAPAAATSASASLPAPASKVAHPAGKHTGSVNLDSRH
jgi:hypothetical protein